LRCKAGLELVVSQLPASFAENRSDHRVTGSPGTASSAA